MGDYGPEPKSYPQLPGPARFIATVVADLEEGKTVVIVFPDTVVDSGVAEAVLDEIHSAGSVREYCVVDPGKPFHARIIETFSLDPVADRDFDDWQSIIRWEAWHGSWVFVPSWDHPDTADILARWPAQVHGSGLTPADCPKLVIGLRLSDIARAAVDRIDRTHIKVRWWWGVLDHLDTQTRLAAVADRRLNPLDAAVITELAVWDLGCVDYLVENWDRTSEGLPVAVRAYQQHAPAACHTAIDSTDRRPTDAPPARQEQAWRAGLLDQWGYSTNAGPRILDHAAIRRRLWLAHNRALTAYIDEERSHYDSLIRKRAPQRALDGLDRRSDDIIEIGSLAWLVSTGRVSLRTEDRERLYAFRDLRNSLAHRTPVNDGLRIRIVRYLGL
ncbi:hypothetical protein D7D52_36525 [Nocardia yunnanensis]|uniref:Uncharacterized protein n=1 Tax=Nocardia yunnanensis TaxID=2382165 RepID=A0A386ZLU0_9NOCA|nr:hypothetical protein [Nocardia yunnanensis]AYF78426.1 hypothetical protein D7D52_36525 [Nocardia yunnanensis]